MLGLCDVVEALDEYGDAPHLAGIGGQGAPLAQPTVCGCADHMGELSTPRHIGRRGAADVDFGKPRGKPLAQLWYRLKSDVMTARSELHDRLEHGTFVSPDVDCVRTRPQHRGQDHAGGVVVAQLPALVRVECHESLPEPAQK